MKIGKDLHRCENEIISWCGALCLFFLFFFWVFSKFYIISIHNFKKWHENFNQLFLKMSWLL